MANQEKQQSNLEKISIKITEWMGSTTSLVVHTIFFIGIFVLYFFGFDIDQIMLILTTAVSLEAIYLSLFIQMTVNRNTASLEIVEKDIDEIQEDVEDIQEDVTEIGDDVEEISKDVDELEDDVEDISEDIDKMQAGSEEGSKSDQRIDHVEATQKALQSIEKQLQIVMRELEILKNKEK